MWCGAQWKCHNETLLMSTHNIFIEKEEKIILFLNEKYSSSLCITLLKGVSAIFSSFDFNEF